MARTPIPLTAATALAALMLGWPAPAPAQSDPAALQLIEQLRPRSGGQTRGIRLPAPADAGTPAPAPVAPAALPQPSMPTPAASPPIAAPAIAPVRPAPAAPVPASVAPAPRPAAPSAVPAATTAPAGVPAVSITVTFPSGSAALTPQAEAALLPLGRALSSPDLAPYRFRIEGHTDTVGDASVNQRLSERRAEAVRAYLVQKHGVSAGRLEAVGLGEERPVVQTGDNVDEPRNRRVQVINLDG
ncbi:OmpA family protein [Falsiroseomonas sp. CW058]|uniref:OmpA family protein n=1 Tax=Falsiroseomonas sp. CW058 TaxID=3388664 RepID=UPI003D321FEC